MKKIIAIVFALLAPMAVNAEYKGNVKHFKVIDKQDSILECVKAKVDVGDEHALRVAEGILSQYLDAHRNLNKLNQALEDCKNENVIESKKKYETKINSAIAALTSSPYQCETTGIEFGAIYGLGFSGDLSFGKCVSAMGRAFDVSLAGVKVHAGVGLYIGFNQNEWEIPVEELDLKNIIQNVETQVGYQFHYLGGVAASGYLDAEETTSHSLGVGFGISGTYGAKIPLKFGKLYEDYSLIRKVLKKN